MSPRAEERYDLKLGYGIAPANFIDPMWLHFLVRTAAFDLPAEYTVLRQAWREVALVPTFLGTARYGDPRPPHVHLAAAAWRFRVDENRGHPAEAGSLVGSTEERLARLKEKLGSSYYELHVSADNAVPAADVLRIAATFRDVALYGGADVEAQLEPERRYSAAALIFDESDDGGAPTGDSQRRICYGSRMQRVANMGVGLLSVSLAAVACGSSAEPGGSPGISVSGAAGASAAGDGGGDNIAGAASSSGASADAGAASIGGAGQDSTGGSAQGGASNGGASAGSSALGGAAGNVGAGGVPATPALTWTLEGGTDPYQNVWGSGPDDIYVAGLAGKLVHSVGDGKWTTQATGTGSHLTGIWAASPTDIYVSVKANFILHSTGDGTWQHQDYTSAMVFEDIWGSGPTDIYAVGGGVVHGTGGGKWTTPAQDPGSGTEFAIWGSSPTDVYVARDGSGDQTISHSTGDGKWKTQTTPSGAKMQAIWGADATHVYAAGGNTLLFSAGDGVWTSQLTLPGTEYFGGLWGLSANEVYACTSAGHFYRSDGHRWSEPQTYDPSTGALCYGIWGTAEDNLYLATGRGIFHGTK